MSVLAIMLVPTTKASALTYTAKDNIIIDTKYYEFFKAQFGKDKSYKFFAYDCEYNNYNRTCYYGIDKDFNYIDISYTSNSYSDLIIKKGTDTNFSVSGVNVIEVQPDTNLTILYAITFFIVLNVANDMTSIIFAKERRARKKEKKEA